MEIFKQIAPLKAFLEGMKRSGKTIGLVPTMGALHKGHISLIEASKSNNSFTVASLYINPTQFNNPLDHQRYPKTFDKDAEMLEKAGCDLIFCPDDAEMYTGTPIIQIDFGHLGKVMEGKYRPGHFNGVALIVSKLFNIIQPDDAYFGQKDWQQFTIICQLAEELKFNLRLHSVPIVRESNGLAMSSRNLRLSETQRNHAAVFFQALTMARMALKAGQALQDVKMAVREMVNDKPDINLQYFELANSKNLHILKNVDNSVTPIMCIAGYVGEVRLIDNMFLD